MVGKTLTMVSLLTQLALHLAVQHQRLPVLVYLCVRHRSDRGDDAVLARVRVVMYREGGRLPLGNRTAR